MPSTSELRMGGDSAWSKLVYYLDRDGAIGPRGFAYRIRANDHDRFVLMDPRSPDRVAIDIDRATAIAMHNLTGGNPIGMPAELRRGE
jgi:hypothetical protein